MSALTIAITKLKATSAVTDITTVAKIYPIVFPQNFSPPCLVVNQVGAVDRNLLEGKGAFYRHRISIECLQTTPEGIMTLGDAVLNALHGVVNEAIGAFRASILFADLDLPDFADDRSVYRRTIDFSINWRAA